MGIKLQLAANDKLFHLYKGGLSGADAQLSPLSLMTKARPHLNHPYMTCIQALPELPLKKQRKERSVNLSDTRFILIFLLYRT